MQTLPLLAFARPMLPWGMLSDARERDVGFMVFDHSHDQPSTPVMQSLAMHVDGTPSTGFLSIYNQQAPGSQDTERTRSQQKAPPGTHDTRYREDLDPAGSIYSRSDNYYIVI